VNAAMRPPSLDTIGLDAPSTKSQSRVNGSASGDLAALQANNLLRETTAMSEPSTANATPSSLYIRGSSPISRPLATSQMWVFASSLSLIVST
jgi:hypothetical protein